MASRTADTTLVKGAREAYRNLDNVPGIYAGLDKIGQAGIKMMETARIEKQKAELEKKMQNRQWDMISTDVLKKSGSFKSATDRNLSFDIVSGIKQDYLTADNDKDKAAALIALQNETDYINGLVDFRAKIASTNLSKAMDKREGGNTGIDKEILTSFLEEGYTAELVDGERVFSGETPSGYKYSLTKAQLEDLYIPPNPAYARAYDKVFNQEHNAFRFSRNNVKNKVNQSLPPQGEHNDLYAFVNDNIRYNQNFYQMLNEDDNLLTEIQQGFKGDEFVDTNTDGEVSDTELQAFKLAVIDPNSPVWGGDKALWEKYCRPIVVDRLTNAIENENNILYADRDKKQTTSTKTKTELPDAPPAGATLTALNGNEFLVDEIIFTPVDDITKVIEKSQRDKFYESGGKQYQPDDEGKLIELKVKKATDQSKL